MKGKPRPSPVWLMVVSICIAVGSLAFGTLTAKATNDRIAFGIAAMATFASGLMWVWLIRRLQKELGGKGELIETLNGRVAILQRMLEKKKENDRQEI